MKKRDNLLTQLSKTTVISFIGLYRLILRPLFPSACRFTPTCSEYTLQAVSKYGAIKGVWLGIKRISRCHGGNPGGLDEVK